MTSTIKSQIAPQVESEASLGKLVWRVAALTFVVAYIEAIAFIDFNEVYAGIMTGNTVELGRSLSLGVGTGIASFGSAVGCFFLGCICASLIKRNLSKPYWAYLLSALILVIVCLIRPHTEWHHQIELPLLALAVGIQGQTISSFGGVAVQTIVVTNSIVKFCDAFTGRYLGRLVRNSPHPKRPALKEVLLPGCSWLTFMLAAAIATMIDHVWHFGLFIPAVMLLVVVADFHRKG